MKATKEWGACSCDCGRTILPGAAISIVEGAIYLEGHQFNRRTRQMGVIPMDAPAPPKKRQPE